MSTPLSIEQRTRVQQMVMHYVRCEYLGQEGHNATESWHVRIVDTTEGVEGWDRYLGPVGDEVGQVHLVRAHSEHPSLGETLEQTDNAQARVGAALVVPSLGGQLDERVTERLGAWGERFLILNNVQLSAAWRGYGLGALFAGMALESFAPGCALAATVPEPDPAHNTNAAQDAGRVKLETVWSQLTFVPLRDGVWIADLSSLAFTDAVSSLRERFGLSLS